MNDSCKHSSLLLLPDQENRLRCRQCHLTIKANDLGDSHCPECFEDRGEKRYDFEDVEMEEKEGARYRCEECGLLIDCA